MEPAEAFGEHGAECGTVWRDAPHQRDEVRRTEETHAASEDVRRERHADECGIAAVTATENADASRIGVSLMNRPVQPVEQISMHLPGPLAIARVQILLSVTGRAAEVDLQHAVAAVRKPLDEGIVPPVISTPRTAVREQNQRKILRRPARRQREVAIKSQAIAGCECVRMLLRQHAVLLLREITYEERLR